MVNCVMRQDRRRVRQVRCTACGATCSRFAHAPTKALRATPLMCDPCSRKAAIAAAVPARGAGVERRRAATTGGVRHEPGNCFTALFQNAEARSAARNRSRASSAHLLGMQRRVRTPTSASVSVPASASASQGRDGLESDPPASNGTVESSARTARAAEAPAELDRDRFDLRRQPTRPRRHTTSTLRTLSEREGHQDAPNPSQERRRRLARAKSQQYPIARKCVDLSYLSVYK